MNIAWNLSEMTWRLAIAMLALGVCILAGCSDQPAAPGIAATVNGDPVTLEYVQTVLDSRAPSQSEGGRASLEQTRSSYADALASAIALVLVRQEMAKSGIDTDSEIADQFARMEADFGEDGLDKYLADSAIRRDEWRQLTGDRMIMELFRERVLLPKVRVPLSEIREYFAAHRDSFMIDEGLFACFMTSGDRERIEKWCSGIAAAQMPADNGVLCLYTRPEEIPDPWKEAVKKQQLDKCSSPRELDGQWQSVAVLERQSARSMAIAEAYAIIEQELKKEKLEQALDAWLAERIATADIRLAPEMARCMAQANPLESDNESAGDQAILDQGK